MTICFGVILFKGSKEEISYIRSLTSLRERVDYKNIHIHISIHNTNLLSRITTEIDYEDLTFDLDMSNSGYAGGFNKTLKFAQFIDADLAFFSNTDIKFEYDDFVAWISEIISCDNYVAPIQLLNSDRKVYGSSFGIFPITRAVWQPGQKIDSALGALMYSKKNQFRILMNEQYFMYNEEHEYFNELKKTIEIKPSARFHFLHAGAQSSSKTFRLLMIRKNLYKLCRVVHKNMILRILSFVTNYISLTIKIIINRQVH